VLASDQRGAEGVLVAAYSAMTTASRPVRISVIGDGMTAETQRRMTEAWRASPNFRSAHFVSIKDLPLKFPSSWYYGRWPMSSCARFQVAAVVPEDSERCVYLDYDTLTGTDLAELVDRDMGGFPVGMVPAFRLPQRDRDYVETLGMDPDKYCNAGVMLIDVAAWRRDDVARKLIAHGAAMSPKIWFFDQDMLNTFFKDRCLLLEERWNMRDLAVSPEGNVIHFAGGGMEKPWRVDAAQASESQRAWLATRAELDFEAEPYTPAVGLAPRLSSLRAKIQRRFITLGRRFA
jgi:lipopolysaccharide biosynthesis glycosyltransferase